MMLAAEDPLFANIERNQVTVSTFRVAYGTNSITSISCGFAAQKVVRQTESRTGSCRSCFLQQVPQRIQVYGVEFAPKQNRNKTLKQL